MTISKEAKIGVVIVLIITAFIMGMNFLKGKNVFDGSDIYYVKYKSIDGLVVSSPVTLNGLKVGQVEDVELDYNSFVLTVEISVKNDVKLPQGSKAVIYNLDLMGSKGIKLVASDNRSGVHIGGDTLEGAVEEDLTTQLKNEFFPLKGQIASTIEALGQTFTSINGDDGNRLKVLIADLNKTLNSLNSLLVQSKPKVAGVLTNVENFTGNLAQQNENISEILLNLRSLSDSLNSSDIKSTISNVDKSFAELSTVLADIKKGKGTLGQLSQNDSLYINLNQTIINLDKLIVDLKENPGRYVKVSVF
ncbi:MAG: MlaD family protein [Bacteroidales bacterium]|jgi:phospholipid/cholesterol/gamma-HCH transport system substrate-binding protein|nr:MlaD family protein [Bacteroidales bacterium]